MLLRKMDDSHHKKRLHRVHCKNVTKRVNLQWHRIWWPEEKRYVRLRLCREGLMTIRRLGLQRAAQRFWLRLEDPKLSAGFDHKWKKFVNLSGGIPQANRERLLQPGQVAVNIPSAVAPAEIAYELTREGRERLNRLVEIRRRWGGDSGEEEEGGEEVEEEEDWQEEEEEE
eukprot:GHVS01012203.1.p2 GENE.GHVS01012203.1~~GHVS01012203.1.p2  ORF type:complete len:171 (+),score=47.82 GHVS01012203.1:452-964(+)